jgi:hypothetical protein
MAHQESYPELPYRRLEQPAALTALIPLFIGGGLIALIAALLTNPDRAWRAYHFNWLYFTSIAQGACILAVVVSITRGVWSRPIRRLALSFVTYLPIAWLLSIPILLFGAKHIFPWVSDPHTIQPGKDAYLNVPFMSLRVLVLLGILFTLELIFAYWSLRPDIGLVKDRESGDLRALHDKWTRNWRGQELEELTSFRKLGVLGPVIAIVFALAFGVLAWDFVMSLEPTWYSTMIGPWFFMGAFLGGVAWTVIVSALYHLRGNAANIIEHVTLHDIGKLMFGLCVFWAYLFYSQYIVIWYGLLPIEQAWLVHRLDLPFRPFMAAVFACLFIIPFFGLMGVMPKRKPQILLTGASVVAIGLWLERYIMVYPSLYFTEKQAPFGWQEIGIALFFLGLVLAAITTFQRRLPIFQMWQPASEIELLGVPPIDQQVTAPDDQDVR